MAAPASVRAEDPQRVSTIKSRMKILLISNYLPDQQQSMLRYAAMLQRECNRRGWQAEIIHPLAIVGGFSWLRGSLKKWLGYVDKYLFAPGYLWSHARHADLVHICDHSNAMYLRCAGTRPALITCHDLLAVFTARGAYPQMKTGATGRILQRWIAASISQAKFIICVSTKTQQDLKRLDPEMDAYTEVIYHSLNWPYAPAPPEAIAEARKNSALNPNGEYLLHVGGNQWYKNRLGTMQIFAALQRYPRFQNVKLIMAGKPWTSEMRQYSESQGLTEKIIERNSVANEELQALYSGSMALVFPSVEEGFGWPLLEAQACGCPVITSARAPMTEVAGDGALFIDPADPEAAARTIADYADKLPALRVAGTSNLARFDADIMMNRYISFYLWTIEEKSHSGSE